MEEKHPESTREETEMVFATDTKVDKKIPTATESGIYLCLPCEEIAKLKIEQINRLKRAATPTIHISQGLEERPERTKIELFEELPSGELKLPKGNLRKYLTIVPNLKVIRGKQGESLPVIRDVATILPLSIKDSKVEHKLDPGQIEILEKIFERREGGLIHSAMGSGKAMMVCCLVYGLPLLRPVAVSGKGKGDVLQLFNWLRTFGEKNPEWKEEVILSGCGKTPTKKQQKILEEGNGIFLCTHAGLQNLPEDVQLLILDEAHAAATPKRIAQIFLQPQIKRIYGLSGTLGLRTDGGDRLLEAVCGPIFTTGEHEKFEKTKRVAPTEIHVYEFAGTGEYLPNPMVPSEQPEEGYGIQQTWVENHRGRHQFAAELALYLPRDQTKVVFTPHIIHAVRIQKAILLAAKLRGITFQDGEEPILLHAQTKREGRNKSFFISKEEQEARVRLLKHGILKLVICTDFFSTGVDTNMIDHIIDISGQKALITSIQRSGRGSRPRINKDGSEKINKIHIILDLTRKMLRILGEQKILALREYYGHNEGKINKNRVGGYYRYHQPPWNPKANGYKAGIELPMMPADRIV